MIEEEIFEVNKKIKQIEGILDKRKQKALEWNVNYKQILQEKFDKNTYLEKQCPSKLLFSTQNFQEMEEKKVSMRKRCAESRKKISSFYNELKELDILQKKKSKIRIINTRSNQSIQKQKLQAKLQIKQKPEKSGNIEVQQSEVCSRTIKDRYNPFANCKADRFIDFYQQNKNNEDQLGSRLMRHFGVGAENTPIGPMLKKQQRRDELKIKKDSNPTVNSHVKCVTYGKKFTSAFKEKQNWFKTSPAKNMFQDRVKKIIKYHGQFWNDELNVV